MDLLTTAEAAGRLGVSSWHVARMAKQGKLKPALQGPGKRGAYFFAPEEISRYLREQADEAADLAERRRRLADST